MTTMFLSRQDNDLIVLLQVRPGAKKSHVMGIHGDRLKISIAKPADKGKANEELIAFLAELLQKPKSDIEILSGHASSQKRIRIACCSETYFIESVICD